MICIWYCTTEEPEDGLHQLYKCYVEAEKYNMEISREKTKSMIVGKESVWKI